MRSVQALFLCLLLFSLPRWVSAQWIKISVFNEIPVKSIVVSSVKGNYVIHGDNTIISDLKNDAIYITLFNNHLLLRDSQKAIGTFSALRFETTDTSGVLKLSLLDPKNDTRQLDNNLQISVAFGRILMCNEVMPDNYIAGVVEAEAGGKAEPEFYKAQAILARTYLYSHINRHESEGFNICDGVHCQAFKGRPLRNPDIRKCTRATAGFVIIDKDSAFVTAVFHANCGGETESSENAWLNNKNYLQPVADPFCVNSPSAKWSKTIPLDQWKVYLKGQGFKFSKTAAPSEFDFTQDFRRKFYKVNNDSLPLRQMRTYFQLRSTFFSIIADKNNVKITGKGFGHGVGMCQDGAMQMARVGYKCNDILNFYYKNILIVKYHP